MIKISLTCTYRIFWGKLSTFTCISPFLQASFLQSSLQCFCERASVVLLDSSLGALEFLFILLASGVISTWFSICWLQGYRNAPHHCSWFCTHWACWNFLLILICFLQYLLVFSTQILSLYKGKFLLVFFLQFLHP